MAPSNRHLAWPGTTREAQLMLSTPEALAAFFSILDGEDEAARYLVRATTLERFRTLLRQDDLPGAWVCAKHFPKAFPSWAVKAQHSTVFFDIEMAVGIQEQTALMTAFRDALITLDRGRNPTPSEMNMKPWVTSDA